MSLFQVLTSCSSPCIDASDIQAEIETASPNDDIVGKQLPLCVTSAAPADVLMKEIEKLLHQHRSNVVQCLEKLLKKEGLTQQLTSRRTDRDQEEEQERTQKQKRVQETQRLWEDVDSKDPSDDCTRSPDSQTQLPTKTGPELGQSECLLPKDAMTLSIMQNRDDDTAMGDAHLLEQVPLPGTSDGPSSRAFTNRAPRQGSFAINAHGPQLYPLVPDKPHESPTPCGPTSRNSFYKPCMNLDKLHQDVKARIAAKIADSGNSMNQQNTSCLYRFTTSSCYEQLGCFLVLLNSVFVGFATQQHANRVLGLQPSVFVPEVVLHRLEGIFLILFSVDLILRWVAAGFIDFWKSETGWNLLDFFVVTLGTMDLMLQIATRRGHPLGTVSALRVLRIIRIVRVAKVVRVLRFFRELRLMICSIASSLKSLCWVIAVLLLLLFGFGIFFTVSVVQFLETSVDHSVEELLVEYTDTVQYFGTLDRSVLSLFMAMSGGNDWAEFFNALRLLPSGHGAFSCMMFVCFITFAMFAVINIVTGIFVENATQSSANDKSLLVQEQLENKMVQYEVLRCLFTEMDREKSGVVRREDFESLINQEDIRLFLKALQLDVNEASFLFQILDRDASGDINVDEFIEGCYDLQGEATSLEQKCMHLDVKSIRDRTATLGDEISNLSKAILEMRQDLVACKR